MNRPRLELQSTKGRALLCLAALASGCGRDDEGGTGALAVLLEAEDTIIDGIEPGDGTENIADGWAVSFDKYIATVGNIDLHFATEPSLEEEADGVFVVDLTHVPAAGLSLWTLEGLREGRWDLHYRTPGAGEGSARHPSVDEADYDDMVDNGWTYLIDGLLVKENGQSCPPAALADPGSEIPNGNVSGDNECYDAPAVRVTLGATAETRFGPCVIDGVPGFAVSANRVQTVAASIHGDHLFFNGFPEGDEGGVTRLAQWLADCDLNLDGTVTRDELEGIAPSQLPELDDRFQLGGSPIMPLANMYSYVTGQLKTQGHFQGEGECQVDGMEHDHDEHDR